MKRLVAAVGAGALMVVLGACGQAQQSSSTPAQVEPVNGIAQGGDRPVPENQVDGTRLPAGYPKQAWTDGNGAVLTVQGQEGGCEHVSAQLAEQTSTAVRITLIRYVTGTNRPCTKDLRIKKLTVQLDKPLSNRSVVLEDRTAWS